MGMIFMTYVVMEIMDSLYKAFNFVSKEKKSHNWRTFFKRKIKKEKERRKRMIIYKINKL